MIKNERVPSGYQMISFDVPSLLTMIPLDYTVDLTLNGIYGDKNILCNNYTNERRRIIV